MGHGSHGSWVKSSMGHLGHGSLWVTHSLLWHGLSNELSTKVLYAAPNFLKMGIKHLNLSSLSTIQDEKSAAKFRYIKTVSGKVVAQSIAFRVVSTHWQGGRPLPPEILAQTDPPPPGGSEFDTLCLVAPQPCPRPIFRQILQVTIMKLIKSVIAVK